MSLYERLTQVLKSIPLTRVPPILPLTRVLTHFSHFPELLPMFPTLHFSGTAPGFLFPLFFFFPELSAVHLGASPPAWPRGARRTGWSPCRAARGRGGFKGNPLIDGFGATWLVVQKRFGVPVWEVGEFTAKILEPVLVVGLGCSLKVRGFDPWPHGGGGQK